METPESAKLQDVSKLKLGPAGKGAWLTKFAIESKQKKNSLMQKQHRHCLWNIYESREMILEK